MKQKRKKLEKIFAELCKIEDLYKSQSQAISYCYENDIDFFHVFEINDILSIRLRNLINRLDIYLMKMYK